MKITLKPVMSVTLKGERYTKYSLNVNDKNHSYIDRRTNAIRK